MNGYTDKWVSGMVRLIVTIIFLIILGSSVPHIIFVVTSVLAKLMPMLNF